MARLTNEASSGALRWGQIAAMSGKISLAPITGRTHISGPSRESHAPSMAMRLASRSLGTLL